MWLGTKFGRVHGSSASIKKRAQSNYTKMHHNTIYSVNHNIALNIITITSAYVYSSRQQNAHTTQSHLSTVPEPYKRPPTTASTSRGIGARAMNGMRRQTGGGGTYRMALTSMMEIGMKVEEFVI